jgi:predicted acylesterase/phospholipase RssA
MPYRLAITIAGAVSLGSFEAGVLFEVLDALGQHNQASPPDARIYIDVLTGASAGGMTAAITAQNLLYSARAVAEPYDNVFYNAWVAAVDIDGLLPLGANESANQSVLSSNFVMGLAQKFLLGRYAQQPTPSPVPHPALNPDGSIRLGLALSNLNGVDYQRLLMSGGTFNYTQFGDQIAFLLSGGTDTDNAWTPVTNAAVACGAFPFAFRPCDLSRDIKDYDSPYLAPWPNSPRMFTYTDGGVFQNQPLGLAKNLVDFIDQHKDSETRSYLFVSPLPVDPTVGSISEGTASFKLMTGALVNAVYNQAGFQDWIEAESVNDAVKLLNLRASQLLGLFKSGVLQAPTIQSVMILLLTQFRLSATNLQFARTQLRTQFAQEYGELSSSMGTQVADVWIDTVLLLELAADLHEKDEMYIYSITAAKNDLAGAGFFSFLGFLYRSFRDHDYDLGRQKAKFFLETLSQVSRGKLPQITYAPKPIHPIQPTPPDGFSPKMIPEQNRKQLCDALSKAADNMLTQQGVSWVIRKGIEAFYVNRKIKGILDLG